jgi:ABC-2 type transport system permease protein
MKRSLKSYLKIYFMMISQDFKSKMQYRVDFWISTIGMLMMNSIGIISFWIIFKSIPSIEGFSYNEMLFMYGFAMLSAIPMQLFFDNLWALWHHCESGEFIKYCFKPVNLFFYYVAETFDAKGLGQVAFGIITLAYSWIKLSIPFTLANIAFLLLSLIGSGLVVIGIMTFASAFAFLTLHGNTILIFTNRFREYGHYPTKIFSKVFRFIFTFVIPIGFLSYYPSLFFLRHSNGHAIAFLSPIIGVIFFYIGYKFWIRCALHYAGTGT